MKVASFFGHKQVFEDGELEEKVMQSIRDCIENRGIYTFYLGGMGMFDNICAHCVKKMKSIYHQIESYLVVAYLKEKLDDYTKQYRKEMFTGIIYPPIDNIPPKWAISRRNKWMVEQSDYLIFYVNYSWGGAVKSLELAQKKGKEYINLGRKE